MEIVRLIQKVNTMFQEMNLSPLESITVDRATAEKLKAETSLIRRYASTIRLPHNNLMIDGTLIIAPVNFNFGD